MSTSTYSGTAESGQQVVAPERLRFTVERGVMDWQLSLGGASFRIDQYGKVRGWSALQADAVTSRPRMMVAWERLKQLHWLGRAGRLSDAKRAGLESYAHALNEAGL